MEDVRFCPTPQGRKARGQVQVAALLGEMSQRQIAQLTGVTERTVRRDVAAIQEAMVPVKEKLEAYRAHVDRHLPLEYRARRLRQLADQNQARPTSG